MKDRVRIPAMLILCSFLLLLFHDVVPHVHHSHDHEAGAHHHHAPHHAHHDHSGDSEPSDDSDHDFLWLLFAHHSHTVEVPTDLLFSEEFQRIQNMQPVALVASFHWSPDQGSPPINLLARQSHSLVCGLVHTPASLRAPPALS